MWAIVGSYREGDTPGGLSVMRFDPDSQTLTLEERDNRDLQAGYVVVAENTGMVYCVDERKTDGRGPVGPAASVHAFAFDRVDGRLEWQCAQRTPGPFPTFLDFHEAKNALVSASHGSFEHVEHVTRDENGDWQIEYHYDASTVILHRLTSEGGLDGIADLHVLEGHGLDPNSSPQAGGHCQSSAHAHCATFDPSGEYVVVCDKGTDCVRVYRLGEGLKPVSRYQFAPETAPRHVAFAADGKRLFMTLELSSEVASLNFDPETGTMSGIDQVGTTAADFDRLNEPAEIRLHPNGRYVYVNNRGEDSLAWFSADANGNLRREGSVRVAKSIHPGLAARSFVITPDGKTLMLADRPANVIRIYSLDPETGAPIEVGQAEVSAPAFVALTEGSNV